MTGGAVSGGGGASARSGAALGDGELDGRGELAAAQEALVAALVAGGPLPEGFDAVRVDAAAAALLHKRAGEVARAWPWLAAAYGREWRTEFAGWAAGRPTRGSWRDGWDFARDRRASPAGPAADELAMTEARWAYDGRSEPRPRRLAIRRLRDGVIIVAFGRARVLRRRRR